MSRMLPLLVRKNRAAAVQHVSNRTLQIIEQLDPLSARCATLEVVCVELPPLFKCNRATRSSTEVHQDQNRRGTFVPL